MADKLRSFGVKVIIVDVPRPRLGVDAGCRAGRSASATACNLRLNAADSIDQESTPRRIGGRGWRARDS
jgi:hypothetical protein